MTDRTLSCPDRALALHALVDGELDALGGLEIEGHLRVCGSCRAELARIEAVRAAMATGSLRHELPASLGQSINAIAGASPRSVAPSIEPRSRVSAWLGGGVLGALAAAVLLAVAVPGFTERGLANALVDGQIRSLQGGHLVDVPSSDRHTVKPWFNGRIDYAPPVIDLADDGFPLVGGRLDVIQRESVAVLVYRRRAHTINLYIRPVRGPEGFGGVQRRSGFNLVQWSAEGLEFWAVSDLESDQLRQFQQLFSRQAAPG